MLSNAGKWSKLLETWNLGDFDIHDEIAQNYLKIAGTLQIGVKIHNFKGFLAILKLPSGYSDLQSDPLTSFDTYRSPQRGGTWKKFEWGRPKEGDF